MLYIVSTPIGNLGDITVRALEVLNAVDMIACEDTRHSLKLLNHYKIKKHLIAHHKFNEKDSVLGIVKLLNEGKNIALITDAGTPIISDPGNLLVKSLIENNLEYTSLPGACAFVNALVLSGEDSSSFSFYGFLPKNNERKKFLNNAKGGELVKIFYTTPHSINDDVKDLFSTFGDAKACLVREMTKINEEAIHFNLSSEPNFELKGEMVLIVKDVRMEVSFENITPFEHLMGYINSGMEKGAAIKLVSKERGVNKNEIYKLISND